eukprot:CAMPEP_0118936768 /NCGR_PEP_ID=MMETSP1169-20130426/20390_1 /TAXON_ID=36882 /ORGANISM="Pyramimonas obovata, Strain CCMP722" /LENGTH=108 /DNA_ID=CAMNT_0006880155 /DNA_START=115 /DNA_END=438 /DNA_ORIENTATION=-
MAHYGGHQYPTHQQQVDPQQGAYDPNGYSPSVPGYSNPAQPQQHYQQQQVVGYGEQYPPRAGQETAQHSSYSAQDHRGAGHDYGQAQAAPRSNPYEQLLKVQQQQQAM